MATEVESMPSPPLLHQSAELSNREEQRGNGSSSSISSSEVMSTCQVVDVRSPAEDEQDPDGNTSSLSAAEHQQQQNTQQQQLAVGGGGNTASSGSGSGAAGGSSSGDMSQGAELSIKMLMSSRDVGSIIGKGGMTIKAFRETSGARINISNSTSSERLVQIMGSMESITKAFAAIGKKIELDAIVAKQSAMADGQSAEAGTAVATGAAGPTQVSFKLVIQSSQCGSIIGKGGSKIKEIRESTGASIQVAGDTLPNSTERAVTISGTSDALTLCINQISAILMDNPAKGPNVPYKPHSLPNQAYQPRANPTLPYQTPYTASCDRRGPLLLKTAQVELLSRYNSFQTTAGPATATQQMRIPNNLIGCVIGRKGSKINEIRVSSGAQIKIASNEGDDSDRLVTITGTPEAVGVAQYLISSRIHSEVNTFMTVGGGASLIGGGANLAQQ